MKHEESQKATNKFLAKLKSGLLEIEKRDDISEDEKVSLIIRNGAIVCAAVAVQPIPFADIFILTPIQIYMVTRIGAIRGMSVSKSEVTRFIKEVFYVVGLGKMAQLLVLFAYKTGLPVLGGLMTIPLVFGLTYAIGRVMDAYFQAKRKGKALDKEQIKSIWRQAKKEGKAEGKRSKDEVKEQSR